MSPDHLTAAANAGALTGLCLFKIFTFICLILGCKDHIILVQHCQTCILNAPPNHLSDMVTEFLAASLDKPIIIIHTLWDILKDEVWFWPSEQTNQMLSEAYTTHSWPCQLTKITLYPPSYLCSTEGCLQTPLKAYHQKQTIVFTLQGVEPALAIHLYCPTCHTSYHNNYSMHNDEWTYYSSKPKYLQVGEHQYVEDTVIKLWISLMLLGV
ncbi:hypothetical protein DL96DRAFT_1470089 [Flagelloscypha sp. PMI_526]|nr:hypothetical protein DL96DRAFT_1470089 [Flagelloscypha sp. PMI_526]